MANDFLGKRIAFPLQLNNRRRLATVEGDVGVRQAIYIIIYTVPGERVMRPTFGCQIHELLFAPANDDTAALAERYVRAALDMWEPRITLQQVKVTPGATEYGELYIEIEYVLKGQHDPRSLVFPFYLNPQQ